MKNYDEFASLILEHHSRSQEDIKESIYFLIKKISQKKRNNLELLFYKNFDFLPKLIKDEWLKREIFKVMDKLKNDFNKPQFSISTNHNLNLESSGLNCFAISNKFTHSLLLSLNANQYNTYKLYNESEEETRSQAHWYRTFNEFKKKIDLPFFEEITNYLALIGYLSYLIQSLESLSNNEPLRNPSQSTLQFTPIFTPGQLIKLFDALKGEYISNDAEIEAFQYFFGGIESENEFKPLKWVGTIKDLNAFVNTFYSNEVAKWNKTQNCFYWNNQPIKTTSLKNAFSKGEEPPKSTDYFEALKKIFKST